MGTRDIETAVFFDDDRRYADLLNGYIFDGKQIVTEKQFYSQDTREVGKSRRGSLTVKKKKNIQRFRDGVKRVAFGTSFTIIALEHQDKIHRGMPVRIMVEDALSYDRQMKKIQKQNREKGVLDKNDYISSLTSTDVLTPVITIVIYYGEKPWDIAKDIYEILDHKNLPEEIKIFINHYPIHVLDVRRFTNEECFKTDVREVFGFIRRSSDKKAVEQYLKEREKQFENIDEDAYDLIAAMTDTKQLQQVKEKYRSEEGGINMCKGLLDWVEESKMEGEKQGMRRGITQGKAAGELTILNLITAMQLDGRTSEITRLSSEPEFLEGMKKHYHIQ